MSGGKRAAEYQIKKDERPDDDMEFSGPVMASAEVMSKRNIIMPKARKFTGTNSQVNTQESDKNNKVKALNDKFIDSINKLNSPNSIANLKPLAQKYIEYYDQIHQVTFSNQSMSVSGNQPSIATPTTAPSNGTSDKPNPFAFLKPTEGKEPVIPTKPAPFSFGNKPAAEKSNEYTSGFKFNNKPSESVPKPSSGFSFGDNSHKDTSKPITSFNFGKTSEIQNNPIVQTEKPKDSFNFAKKSDEITKSTGFSFAASMEKSTESAGVSSESQTKSIFAFGSTNSPMFGAATIASTSTSTSISKPFSFGIASKPVASPNSFSIDNNNDTPKVQEIVDPESKNESTGAVVDKPVNGSSNEIIEIDDSDDASEDEEIKIQGPTFNLTNKPTVRKSPFTFGPKPENKDNDSDSDSESEVEIKGPSFTFNKPIADKVFKFAKSVEEKDEDKNEDAKNEDAKNEDATATFTFGKAKDTSPIKKPAFTFNAQPEVKEIEKPASLTFTKPDNTELPKFDFSSSKPSAGFSFTKTTQSAQPGFSFGSKNEATTNEKPAAFSFTSDKPGFLFDSTNKNSNFSFGSSDKPAFNFGKTDDKMDDTPKPFGGFGVGSNNAFSFGRKSGESSTEEKPKLQFSFNTGSTSTAFGGNPHNKESNGSTPTADDKMPEEETGGDFKPVAKLTSEKLETSTGEENEETMYTKRAKLMLYDKSNIEKPYVNKGVGDLKVLKNKETGKSRILIRADGGLRVLMNNYISNEISYSSVGDGSLVRVPAVNPTTNDIETYMLKVKTPQDGTDLVNTINTAKN